MGLLYKNGKKSYAKGSSTASESLSCLPRQQHILALTSEQQMASQSHLLAFNVHFSQVYTVSRSGVWLHSWWRRI